MMKFTMSMSTPSAFLIELQLIHFNEDDSRNRTGYDDHFEEADMTSILWYFILSVLKFNFGQNNCYCLIHVYLVICCYMTKKSRHKLMHTFTWLNLKYRIEL